MSNGTRILQNGTSSAVSGDDERGTPVFNLIGQRVALGPLRLDLIPLYQRWFNDFATLATLDRLFRPTTTEQVAIWFERRITGPPTQTHSVFTIWERAVRRPLGNAALQEIDPRNRTAELGIFIGEVDRRGLGYGTEASRLLLDFAFQVLGLHSVMLRVFAYNQAACRVYERVGFREFGRRRQCQFMDGRFWDVIYMECLAAEFTEQPPCSPFAIEPQRP